MTACRRVLPAMAALLALLVAVVWVISVEDALAAKSSALTVGDYLVRIIRAMGLGRRVGPRAPADEYLPLLVQQRVISADAARGLRTDGRLTRDFALEVSSRITDPPAPPFLSRTYVVSAFLASHGIALGFVRYNDEEGKDLFEARAHERAHHCPTPNNNNDDDDDRCLKE